MKIVDFQFLPWVRQVSFLMALKDRESGGSGIYIASKQIPDSSRCVRTSDLSAIAEGLMHPAGIDDGSGMAVFIPFGE